MAHPVVELVHRSATRRKACAGCIKAKRRCDLTIPACSRCTTRKLSGSAGTNAVGRLSPASPSPKGEGPTSPPTLETSSPSDAMVLLPQESSTVELINGILPPSPYDSFPFPERTVVEPFRIDYCNFEFQRCVFSLVLENRTLFIHPDLYQDTMPDLYQDLLGVCAMYAQKTVQNSVFVFRMLFLKLSKLRSESKSFVRVEEWLLAVQSLILYQVIRMFDGDPQQKADAERDFDLLEDWTTKLQHESNLWIDGSLHRQWVVVESIRRTIMVSVLLRSLYSAMKSGIGEYGLLLSSLPVSENQSRWEQVEEVDPKASRLVTYWDFCEDWNKGKVKTLDVYEMLLLRVCHLAVTDVQ
ncbi:uncharacterized protein PAC_19367 [Phialocephala subalpina]|uniref:Uncharacterized protein n=1 Tax=Phialocephala subalpina TaxID=576137 RepID=A0A1L7XWT0_9HELO|nr:uncharacterized protein PAC_19367 [Phialocephala subalpina]